MISRSTTEHTYKRTDTVHHQYRWIFCPEQHTYNMSTMWAQRKVKNGVYYKKMMHNLKQCQNSSSINLLSLSGHAATLVLLRGPSQ